MTARAPLIALAVAAIAGCASAPPHNEVAVNVASSAGGGGSLSISSDSVDALVGAVMGGAVCRDLEVDRDLEAVLERLERGGSRARVTVTGDDGRLEARRRGGRLVVGFTGSGGGGVTLELPWGVAACLLGRTDSLDQALSRDRHPSARIELRSADGETYRLEIALR